MPFRPFGRAHYKHLDLLLNRKFMSGLGPFFIRRAAKFNITKMKIPQLGQHVCLFLQNCFD